MHKLIALSALAAVLAGPAFANETQAQCEAYVAENGGDASGCACLGDLADSDPGFASAIAAIQSPEDLDAADQSTKDKIAVCYPPA
ncbi:MAG TPA: hypothetical protein PLV61_16965 [Parvularculaceae bacterium]|nr:hypothetical protein [Amphiplicatus sp.]HPE32889.1 hypothetical protein [Parvularculaceae bacterium]